MAQGIGVGFTDQMPAIARQMQQAVLNEVGAISASIGGIGTGNTITNNNDYGVTQTNNFYSTVETPYQTAKRIKRTMEEVAYGH